MCNYSPNREAAMVTIPTPDGYPGVKGIHCDPCIAPLVSALNQAHLYTIASCCGHGQGISRIDLHDGRALFVVPTFGDAQRLHPDLINLQSQGQA